jgi:hypothetical protein
MKKLLITIALAASALIPVTADSRIWFEVDINASSFTDEITYTHPETGLPTQATRTYFYPYESIYPGSGIGKSKKVVLGSDGTGGWTARKIGQQVSLTWATTWYQDDYVWVPNNWLPPWYGTWQIRPVLYRGTSFTTVVANIADKTSTYIPPAPEE